MRKYLQLLPVMLFPYLFVFVLYVVLISMSVVAAESVNIFRKILLVLAELAVIAVPIASAVLGAVYAVRSDISAYTAAKLNLIVKAVHIPAYIVNFLLGSAGLVMSVWGIGVIGYAIIADVLTIALTGIHSVGCMAKIRKEGVLSTGYAVLAAIGSFIFCADVIIAIVLFGRSRKTQYSV